MVEIPRIKRLALPKERDQLFGSLRTLLLNIFDLLEVNYNTRHLVVRKVTATFCRYDVTPFKPPFNGWLYNPELYAEVRQDRQRCNHTEESVLHIAVQLNLRIYSALSLV